MICASCGEPSTSDVYAPCSACGGSALLDERYVLLEQVGHGAVGTTWRARRLSDDVIVAIKELLVRRLDDFKTQELFEREARVLRELEHPGVLRYHDDFSAGHGRQHGHYLVTDFVEGQTLEAELESTRFTEAQVLVILAQLAEVLAYLHTRQPPVVHRDLKPANVMRRRADGRLLLIDFGAVREAMVEGGGSTVAGTFGYMAPEQLMGQASPASDVYALGVLAVALLSRQSPHDLLDAEHQLQWRRALSVTPACEALLDAMLARDPVRRLPNGVELIAWVKAAQAGRRLEGAGTQVPALAAEALPLTRSGQGSLSLTGPRRLPEDFARSAMPYYRVVQGAVGGLLGLGLAIANSATAAAIPFGFIFAVPGLALLGAAWWRFRVLARIWRQGRLVPARLVSVTPRRRSWLVRYAYEGHNELLTASRVTGRADVAHWQPGQPVEVLRLDEDPTKSILLPLG